MVSPTKLFARTSRKKRRAKSIQQSAEEVRRTVDRLRYGSLGPASAV